MIKFTKSWPFGYAGYTYSVQIHIGRTTHQIVWNRWQR